MAVDVRVVVIGAGALGCALLPKLLGMGITEICLMDGDHVEAANLERQPLYDEADIGHPKASTARSRLAVTQSASGIIAHDRFLDFSNARDLLQGAYLAADCTDDLHAKNLLDRACGDLGIPLVSGAVHEQQGQVITLHAPGVEEHLYRSDLFGGRIGAEQDGCDMQRVPLDVIEAVGQRMADRMKSFLHGEPLTNGRIELYDRGAWTLIDAAR